MNRTYQEERSRSVIVNLGSDQLDNPRHSRQCNSLAHLFCKDLGVLSKVPGKYFAMLGNTVRKSPRGFLRCHDSAPCLCLCCLKVAQEHIHDGTHCSTLCTAPKLPETL